jgi:multimeric flavodoxin WrbA
MKVIALNGSPRLLGNTSNILNDLLDEIGKDGIETEQIQLYGYDLDPCNDCRSCEMRGDGRCIMEGDGLNDIVSHLREADGIVLASPSYYGSCTGQMKIFLERAGLPLETGGFGLRRKIGAAVVVEAHDGGSMAYSELVYWMLKNQMIVVGGAPMPIFRAANPPQYLEDKGSMKGLIGMAHEISWAVQNLNSAEH